MQDLHSSQKVVYVPRCLRGGVDRTSRG